MRHKRQLLKKWGSWEKVERRFFKPPLFVFDQAFFDCNRRNQSNSPMKRGPTGPEPPPLGKFQLCRGDVSRLANCVGAEAGCCCTGVAAFIPGTIGFAGF